MGHPMREELPGTRCEDDCTAASEDDPTGLSGLRAEAASLDILRNDALVAGRFNPEFKLHLLEHRLADGI